MQLFACEHETKQELMFCIVNLSKTNLPDFSIFPATASSIATHVM